MNYYDEIEKLKKEKDVLILAHYYVNDEVQDIADKIGDSFQLAKEAQNATNKIICFCGVHFMGECAKILNSDKKVIVPDINAGCAMADMVDIEAIKNVKKSAPDTAIVSYVNTTAEVKSYSDVCVTSSNAIKIISQIPNKNIYFLPDRNLGSYIAKQFPEKNFSFNPGYCKYHNFVDEKEILELKKDTGYDVLVHPECREEVVELGDCIGSTKALLEYVKETKKNGYIVCTEEGIIHQMKKVCPDSIFISPKSMNKCSDMKMNSIEKVYNAILNEGPEIILDEKMSKRAFIPLKRMMELG